MHPLLKHLQTINARRRPYRTDKRVQVGYIDPRIVFLNKLTDITWEEYVHTFLCIFNHEHQTKNKTCSRQTSEARRKFLMQFFRAVWDYFHVKPKNIKERHILWFFREHLSSADHMPQKPSNFVRYVENKICYLAFFVQRIGKAGLVRKSGYYLDKLDPERKWGRAQLNRATQMTDDHVVNVIEKAVKEDLILGLQVMACFAFGFRPREACALQPKQHFVYKKIDNVERLIDVIRPKCGSKGGRPRSKICINLEQPVLAELMLKFCELTQWPTLHHPALSLDEAVARFHRQMNHLGFSKTSFNNTAYSFRHSFAQRMYRFYSKQMTSKQAKEVVALELGHYRPNVTDRYLAGFERIGENTVNKLLTTLEKPQSSNFSKQQAWIGITRDVFHQSPKFGFFLVVWLADKAADSNHALYGLMRDREIHHKAIPKPTEIAEKLANLYSCESDRISELLYAAHGCLTNEQIESQILLPYVHKMESDRLNS